MKYYCVISLIYALMALSSCAVVPSPGPALSDQLKVELNARVKAEHQADEAIKTSTDARAAANEARAEARAARQLADEKDGDAKRLEKLATDLRNQEIASRIAFASWSIGGIGLIVVIVAGFLWIRFESRTAGVAALCGLGCLGISGIGLWLAPHWLLVAWIFGAVLLVVILGGMVWLLLHREKSAVALAAELKHYAGLLPSRMREAADASSLERQSATVAAHITGWLDRAKVSGDTMETGVYEAHPVSPQPPTIASPIP